MVIKTIFMLSLYIIPLIILNSGIVSSIPMLFTLYVIAGLGMAGIGMGIMHDALHGSYSKNRTTNKFLGYSMNLIGANANIWKIQHNVLHHTYTNISEVDDDINAPFFLRFSPHAEKNSLHKFQHLYAWIFYGLSTLSWVVSKDFVRLKRYHQMGFFKEENQYRKELVNAILWKILYFTFSLILPLIMIPLAPWLIVLAFITMHFVTGFSITIVFQTAHIMPGNEFPLPDENGLIASDWTIHQLATTCNYAPNSRIFSWLIGGLNYQIEHHLFPNICHVHYNKISKIVAETAQEFGIPYHIKKTFFAALIDHAKMLRDLGKMETQPISGTNTSLA